MRLLYCGDVMGRAGRKAITTHIPKLRGEWGLDCVAVNGENAAHGFGITEKICEEFFKAGVDVITTGNHAWDQREIVSVFEQEPRLLRPLNYPPGTPGRGAYTYEITRGRKILVIQVMMRLFMDPLDDPFRVIEEELKKDRLGKTVAAILVDVHGEATSEKQAMAHMLDGRVSAVIGTHTHAPTADAQILDGGTAFQSDLGMCGDYNSVIGMEAGPAIARFTTKMRGDRLTPAKGEATLCGALIDIDDTTGRATRIEPVRLGGRLKQTVPEL